MTSFQWVFKRVEMKYRITLLQKDRLLEAAKGMLAPDRFEPCTICNIYYDTEDHLFISRSMEKPVFKEKLRLRSYGVPDMDSPVFVEMKRKYKKTVYKRREAMPYQTALQYLERKNRPSTNSQILRELDHFLDFNPSLAPAMFISYDRQAFIGSKEKDLRLTFDTNILWREEELLLHRGVFGNPLLVPNECLMEIKISGAMPLWLAHTLDSLQIYPCSYSKYAHAYRASKQGASVPERKIHCA